MGGGDRGTIVAIHDATADYQAGTSDCPSNSGNAGRPSHLFLAGMAGRVLSPLRLLTKTAQSITESDMTRRIPKGQTKLPS